MPSYLFPRWWFVVLCMPNFTIHVVSSPLWSLIWPDMLKDISGEKYKALALAAGSQIGEVMSYLQPVVGTLSDKLPDRYAAFPWPGGRRRPFIIFGCLVGAGGIAMTIDAMYRIIALGKTGTRDQYVLAYGELAVSIMIGNLGGTLPVATKRFMTPWVDCNTLPFFPCLDR
jgi:hypothetical protein|eukprot:COSAG01_NODE_805_length_13443_cov_81.464928_10_plen_171_part_00